MIAVTVNGIEIPQCPCGTGGRHWTPLDMEIALGRRLDEADVIEVAELASEDEGAAA